jgi:16S rRNA (uracil1498-N3)-methyltransferase
MERWQRISRQASEQSRRPAAPELQQALKLKEALKQTASSRIVLAETERVAALKDVLRSQSSVKDLSLAVGPEGGWTEDELALLAQAGWISASLGSTILRAETAAIAATAIAVSELS